MPPEPGYFLLPKKWAHIQLWLTLNRKLLQNVLYCLEEQDSFNAHVTTEKNKAAYRASKNFNPSKMARNAIGDSTSKIHEIKGNVSIREIIPIGDVLASRESVTKL